MRERNFIIDNLKINFYESDTLNKENALVFLHGWGSESLHLKSIFEKCNDYIAIDLPGFGKSELPKEIYGVNEYAVFLDSFLKKLGIKNPILIGHSFGGSVIIKYIADGGEAKKMILIASAGIRIKTFKKTIYKYFAKLARAFFLFPGLKGKKEKFKKDFYEKIGSDYYNAGPLVESFKKIVATDLRSELNKIETETVLIWGEDDRLTTLDQARLIHNLIKNSKLFIIKNAGHFSFLDKPDEFNKIFFKEVRC